MSALAGADFTQGPDRGGTPVPPSPRSAAWAAGEVWPAHAPAPASDASVATHGTNIHIHVHCYRASLMITAFLSLPPALAGFLRCALFSREWIVPSRSWTSSNLRAAARSRGARVT